MSDINKIEKLFENGKNIIASKIEESRSKNDSIWFYITTELANEIGKSLSNLYKKEKIDLSSFSEMSQEDKNKVVLSFQDMILSHKVDSRWQRHNVIYCILRILNDIFDSEESFINMSHYYISSSITDSDVSSALLREGYFKNINIFSDILNNSDSKLSDPILELCINKCSASILHKFKNHKSKNIRLIVYQRLGVENCFEEMLKDKDRNVRLEALNYAPRDHEALSCLYGDRSKYVVQKLIKLISRDKAIFLLGNGKIQNNKHLQEALRDKINGAW